MENVLQVERELEKVCKEISELPCSFVPSKAESEREETLWNKKRELLAKLNSYNNDFYA